MTLAGDVEKLARLPEAMFANGITQAPVGTDRIAGSARGTINTCDPHSRETRVWLDHPALKPRQMVPIGWNGGRSLGDQNDFTDTGQLTLGRIDHVSREVTMLHDQILIDDFAVTACGAIYGTIYRARHACNSVVAVAPDGACRIVADATQGARGATSVRLDRP